MAQINLKELVARLQAILDSIGDVPVEISDGEAFGDSPLRQVTVERSTYSPCVVTLSSYE